MIKKFSVLISVYKKENPLFLDKALNSIIKQTLKPNEIVLVEDGLLTNELDGIIQKYIDKYHGTFKVIKFKKNRGLGIALHDGLLECSNDIVFRMDSDDISLPNRFQKQMAVFSKQNVDVVGSNIAEYDENMEKEISRRIVPEKNLDIKKKMKSRNPMNHVTVGYRKSKVLEAGNYMDMPYFEDYYLWTRMALNGCIFYNVQEILVHVRGGNEMIKRRGGTNYIKPIINFEKELHKMKYTNLFECLKNLVIRLGGALMPSKMRYVLYKKILRK